MTNRRVACVAIAAALSGACGGNSSRGSATPTSPSGTLSDAARSHLEQVITLMQANSLHRLTINWTDLRAKVFAEANGAQSLADLYPAIRLSLSLLGDGHSSYRAATGELIFVPTRSCSTPAVSEPSVPRAIGYVRVRSFNGSGAQAAQFALDIQDAIRDADNDGIIGWIVDLRGNGGGNMWPMIVGVGPILGDGVAGYFVDPQGVESRWEYAGNAALLNGGTAQDVSRPYTLRRQRPRVAVLTDRAVASSGEATTIAFRQRPDTRSFGTPTCGLSTANRGLMLANGATLNLTVSWMADRGKQRYGDVVVPDEVVADAADTVARAVEWLQGGPAAMSGDDVPVLQFGSAVRRHR